jgi:glycosyltransferase involved in cell wall biosynthesis
MRVLLVSQRFPPDDVGGVERYTQALASQLAQRGDKVSIVTRRVDPGHKIELVRERLQDGSALYRLVGGSVRFDRFLQDYEPLERLFTLALLESEAEVVHVNHLISLSPRCIQIAHRLGAAVVVSLHDFYFACARIHLQKPDGGLCSGPDQGRECARTCFTDSSANGPVRWGLRTTYFRKLLSSSEAVIAYSDYVGDFFQEFIGNRKLIHRLPNGVHCSHASLAPQTSTESESERPFTIAYCGMVAKHKGTHVILEALKLAALPAVNFVVIGHVPERPYYKQLREAGAAIPGLELQMYGKYERSDLSFLLRDVDCVVVPSLVPEAGPIVPREAMALGVPILVSRLGALPELVVEGENGFTFDATRPAELAARFRQMVEDKTLLPHLRGGALRWPSVSLSEHTELVRRIYSDAINNLNGASDPDVDSTDINFFHESLVALGCEDGTARSSLVRR